MGTSITQAQWDGYARYHQSRANLLLHTLLVPLFLAGNLIVIVGLVKGRWLAALGGAALTFLSLALQGRGHREEPVPPAPFSSPWNALSRIFLEQWVSFPRFALSGALLRALRQSKRA